MAKLLKIGEIEAAYWTPDNFPMSRGAYIIEPGYISILELAKSDFL